jgi:hypothetical protein
MMLTSEWVEGGKQEHEHVRGSTRYDGARAHCHGPKKPSSSSCPPPPTGLHHHDTALDCQAPRSLPVNAHTVHLILKLQPPRAAPSFAHTAAFHTGAEVRFPSSNKDS